MNEDHNSIFGKLGFIERMLDTHDPGSRFSRTEIDRLRDYGVTVYLSKTIHVNHDSVAQALGIPASEVKKRLSGHIKYAAPDKTTADRPFAIGYNIVKVNTESRIGNGIRHATSRTLPSYMKSPLAKPKPR